MPQVKATALRESCHNTAHRYALGLTTARIIHHGRCARIAPRKNLTRQEPHSMAAPVALRSADGLAHRQEAMGGRQETRSGEVTVALTIEAAHEQLESTAGHRNGRRERRR